MCCIIRTIWYALLLNPNTKEEIKNARKYIVIRKAENEQAFLEAMKRVRDKNLTDAILQRKFESVACDFLNQINMNERSMNH